MSNTDDDPGREFSVRDQFAGRQDALQGSIPQATSPAADTRTLLSTGRPGIPLQRRVTANNVLEQRDWHALIRGVLNRMWLIVLIAAVTTGLGLLGSAWAGRARYLARTSLLYRTEHQKQLFEAAKSSFIIKGLARSTALSLLRRTSNMEAVRTNLHLNITADDLRWRLQTKSDKGSEIILLLVDYMPTADSAVKVANEAARVALADNQAFYHSQAIQSAEFFHQQALTARRELGVLNDQLTSYQTSNRMLEVAADTAAFLDRVAAVSERLSAAKIAFDSQLLRIQNYRKIVADLPAEVLRESLEDNPLKRRISNTELALMEARTKYGPANPRVQLLEDEIKEMRRTMGDKSFNETRERIYELNPAKKEFEQELLRMEAERSVLEEVVRHVTLEMNEVEQKFSYLPQKQIELAGFIQHRASAEELCRTLEKNSEEAKLAAKLDLADFELLEPCRAASADSSKLALILPVLALLIGLSGGTVVCAVLELLDPRFKTTVQIELAYSVPCLGAVVTADAGQIMNAFLPVCRTVYSKREQLSAGDGSSVLAVLSAHNAEGKSTLAFQLARYWAGLGIKTAYLDFDERANPQLTMPASCRGIEEYLDGQAAWESVLFTHENVACFKLTARSGNLPERLHGRAMTRLLTTMRTNYACVIIDTPAFLESRSSEQIALLAGNSVWIIDAKHTMRRTVNLAFDSLDRAGIRPIGIVLNFAAPERAAGGKA